MTNYVIRTISEYRVEIFFQRNIPNYLFVRVAKTIVNAAEAMTSTGGKIHYDSFLVDNTGLRILFDISSKKGLVHVKRMATKLNKIYEIVIKCFNTLPF